MSQSPTDSFLQSLVAGTQMLGQAGQNVLGQQQIGLQQAELAQRGQAMQQEERMQQRQLGAQRQMQLQEQESQRRSYADLNASRERMQTQEIEAARLRQQEQQAFMGQQARMEQQLGLAMQKVELELRKVDQQIMATADDDPRLMALRQQRKTMKDRLRKLNQTLGSGVMTSNLAMADGGGDGAGGGGMSVGSGLQGRYNRAVEEKNRRMDSLTAMLKQHREAIDLQYDTALSAVSDAFEVASMSAIRGEAFMDQLGRITEAGQMEELRTGGEGMGVAITPVGAGLRIFLDNVQRWALGSGDPELAKIKTGEFLQRGGVMAADTMHRALSMHGSQFGLDAGEREASAAIAADIVSKAAIISGLDPRSRGIGMAQADELRKGIADGLGKLRQYGMGEAQMEALLDGLEALGSNQAELLRAYTEKEGQTEQQAGMLQGALDEVLKIHDVIDGVASDKAAMAPHGGPLQEPRKFNVEEVGRRGALAYGLAGSPQIEELSAMLKSLGIPEEERLMMMRQLTEEVPGLEQMRPEDLMAAIEAQSSEAQALNQDLGTLEEDLRREQSQAVARSRAQGIETAQSNIDQILAGLAGGGNG